MRNFIIYIWNLLSPRGDDRPQNGVPSDIGTREDALRPSLVSPTFSLASFRRQPNLSFLDFLLISYLPRNRDRRIKRMSRWRRRSPKSIGTQTECRPSFFASPRRPSDSFSSLRRGAPKERIAAIPSFFVSLSRFVQFIRGLDAIGSRKRDAFFFRVHLFTPRALSYQPLVTKEKKFRFVTKYLNRVNQLINTRRLRQKKWKQKRWLSVALILISNVTVLRAMRARTLLWKYYFQRHKKVIIWNYCANFNFHAQRIPKICALCLIRFASNISREK